MKPKFVFGTVALGLVIGGCAITSMEAKVAPSPQIQRAEIGVGKTVAVTVVDERPSENLGKRSSVGGTIYMKQNLAEIYQQAIIDGLMLKGFTAVGSDAAGASHLKVEIRGLQEVSSTGFWTMGTNISAAIKAYADGGPSHYEQMYRGSAEHRTVAVSGAKALNAKLNAVVDDQLEQMFADNMLLATLAGKATASQP